MAIEKTPSKNWELTLYELQRTPQPLITDDSEIAICPLRLSNELKCPICLDFLSNTMATKECLHRFCAQCIVTALRSGNKECPACRKKLVSKRSLRHDYNFDAIIAKLFPYRKEYEAHQAKVMAKQMQNSVRGVKNSLKREKSSEKYIEVNENSSELEGIKVSSSSKDTSSNSSRTKLSKHRNSDKNSSNGSLGEKSAQMEDDTKAIASDSSELGTYTRDRPKRKRQPSSESGERETNCSSSITSDLCSLIGNTTNNSNNNSLVNNSINPTAITNISISNPIMSGDSYLEILLEPQDTRCGKYKFNESFVLQVPDNATVGHLIEYLILKRNNHFGNRKPNFETVAGGSSTNNLSSKSNFTIYLGLSMSSSITLSPITSSSSKYISAENQLTYTPQEETHFGNNSIHRKGSNNRKLENEDELLKRIIEKTFKQGKLQQAYLKPGRKRKNTLSHHVTTIQSSNTTNNPGTSSSSSTSSSIGGSGNANAVPPIRISPTGAGQINKHNSQTDQAEYNVPLSEFYVFYYQESLVFSTSSVN